MPADTIRRTGAVGRDSPAAGNGTEVGAPEPDRTYANEDIDAALGSCDFLVIACPLTDETRGLINAGRLARMKAGAVVINVWTRYLEPGGPEVRPSAHPFHGLDNVIMTPHAAA